MSRATVYIDIDRFLMRARHSRRFLPRFLTTKVGETAGTEEIRTRRRATLARIIFFTDTSMAERCTRKRDFNTLPRDLSLTSRFLVFVLSSGESIFSHLTMVLIVARLLSVSEFPWPLNNLRMERSRLLENFYRSTMY